MTFNWKQIVGTVAPTLATALGGPLAGAAASAVSQAILGKPTGTDTEIAEALAGTLTPDDLVKLKEAELNFKTQMRQLDIDLEKIAAGDRESARQREAAVRDETPRNLAYGYTFGYFAVLALIAFNGDAINAGVKDMINVLLGVLSAAEVGIITYYFGSSAESANKTDMLYKSTPMEGKE